MYITVTTVNYNVFYICSKNSDYKVIDIQNYYGNISTISWKSISIIVECDTVTG